MRKIKIEVELQIEKYAVTSLDCVDKLTNEDTVFVRVLIELLQEQVLTHIFQLMKKTVNTQ